MSKIEITLRSPAFWSLAGMFVYHGLQAIQPMLGGTVGNIVQGALALMAIYFHPTEVQIAGMTGRLGGARIRKD